MKFSFLRAFLSGFATQSATFHHSGRLLLESIMDIPKFRYPFNNNFPTTLTFGSVPEDVEIKKKFTEWSWTGHPGIDFACPEDTEILAVDSGDVVQSGGNGDYGESITLKHSWGTSFYAHFKERKVKEGDKVESGNPIGISGQTGSAFGPHLHFAIKPQ